MLDLLRSRRLCLLVLIWLSGPYALGCEGDCTARDKLRRLCLQYELLNQIQPEPFSFKRRPNEIVIFKQVFDDTCRDSTQLRLEVNKGESLRFCAEVLDRSTGKVLTEPNERTSIIVKLDKEVVASFHFTDWKDQVWRVQYDGIYEITLCSLHESQVSIYKTIASPGGEFSAGEL